MRVVSLAHICKLMPAVAFYLAFYLSTLFIVTLAQLNYLLGLFLHYILGLGDFPPAVRFNGMQPLIKEVLKMVEPLSFKDFRPFHMSTVEAFGD